MTTRTLLARTGVVLGLTISIAGLTAGTAGARPVQDHGTATCASQPHWVFEEDGSAYATTVVVCTVRNAAGATTGATYSYQNGDLEICNVIRGKVACSYYD